MPKLTKRIVEALERDPDRDVFMWDTEVRGFGMRVKPSGTKTFIIQYRNVERRTRRFVIGQYGVLTVEVARDLAKKKLASVIDGSDPSQERRAAREGMTVAEVCDWYLAEAEAGRILGRRRRPIKSSTLAMDRSRIERTSSRDRHARRRPPETGRHREPSGRHRGRPVGAGAPGRTRRTDLGRRRRRGPRDQHPA